MKNKLKYFFGAFIVMMSLVGCTTTQVISPEDSVVPLQSIAEEGDTMLLLDANKEKTLVTNLLGEEVGQRAQRMTLEITPMTDEYPISEYDFNAVIEGDFPSFITSVGIRYGMDGKRVNSDGYGYYEANNLEIGILKPNMVGASSSSYVNLANKIKAKEEAIDKLTVLKMYDANIAMYAYKPKTIFDLGLGLTQAMVNHFDSILLLVSEADDGDYIMNAVIDCDTTASAKTLGILVRTGYLGNLKKQGVKPDFSVLKLMFETDGEIVSINKMPFSDEQYEQLINSISSSI